MTNSRYFNASKSYSAYLTKCFASGFLGNPSSERFSAIPANNPLYRDAIAVGQDLKKAMGAHENERGEPEE